MGSHSRDDIARFMGDGETRLIAASYRDPARAGQVFILSDGEASKHREWAKRELRCLFGDCPSPDLTVVSRSRARDGFRHLSGAGGHAPESIFHLQGKAVVAAWLREAYPRSEVAVEAAIDSQRTRIPDVMITAPTKQRVAFEIQYASLSVDEWHARHEEMRAADVVDVWLFGHSGHQLRRSRTGDVIEVHPTPVQEAVLAAGMPLLWLNPERQEVAVAYSVAQLADRNVPVPPRARTVVLMTIPIETITVSPSGIRTAFLDQLGSNEELVRAHQDEQRKIYLAAQTERDTADRAERQRLRDMRRKQAAAAQRESQRRAELTRVAMVQAAELQRIRQTEKRVAHVARGKVVHCSRCWLPLDLTSAYAGQHQDCHPPA